MNQVLLFIFDSWHFSFWHLPFLFFLIQMELYNNLEIDILFQWNCMIIWQMTFLILKCGFIIIYFRHQPFFNFYVLMELYNNLNRWQNKIVWWSLIYLKTWQFYFFKQVCTCILVVSYFVCTGGTCMDKWHFQIIVWFIWRPDILNFLNDDIW